MFLECELTDSMIIPVHVHKVRTDPPACQTLPSKGLLTLPILAASPQYLHGQWGDSYTDKVTRALFMLVVASIFQAYYGSKLGKI